jgi:hypothetical protein
MSVSSQRGGWYGVYKGVSGRKWGEAESGHGGGGADRGEGQGEGSRDEMEAIRGA